MLKLYFVTGNKGKFEEVRKTFDIFGNKYFELLQKDLNISELDSQDLIEISKDKAVKAFENIKNPLIADDSGIYFEEYTKFEKNKLIGFPGVLAKRVFITLGYTGLYRLLKDANTKRAKFITVISYIDAGLQSPVSFIGELNGTIDFDYVFNASSQELENFKTLPYKYIFKPEGTDKYYFQLTDIERAQVSQRAKALKKFYDWFLKNKIKL